MILTSVILPSDTTLLRIPPLAVAPTLTTSKSGGPVYPLPPFRTKASLIFPFEITKPIWPRDPKGIEILGELLKLTMFDP